MIRWSAQSDPDFRRMIRLSLLVLALTLRLMRNRFLDYLLLSLARTHFLDSLLLSLALVQSQAQALHLARALFQEAFLA